ncbi:helix-turn-helix domain-containing protein [Streptomyces sp. NPDC006290]|uniref:helix-turn-helix domain-containing protein n=1 Tax=Streptomyces sp. NPDC006290 TaxID=3156745 RepID=UPI0033B43A8D
MDSYRTATSQTQGAVAEALHVSASTLSRYLNGERVASLDVLSDIRDLLAEQGIPLSPEDDEKLRVLCEQAHLASGAPGVQLAYYKDQIAGLRRDHQNARQLDEARLSNLEEQLARHEEQLKQALPRARTAEGARQTHHIQVAEQDKSLRHDQESVRGTAEELDQQREQTLKLLHEVGELREQNREFLERQQKVVPDVSTQVKPESDTGAEGAPRVGATGGHTTREENTPQIPGPSRRGSDAPGFRDVAGAVSLIGVIDGLAVARLGRRLPVVQVVSGTGQSAADFVKAYAGRLSAAGVPHAVIDAALLGRIDAAGSDGFGQLLDEVAARLKKSFGGPAGELELRDFDLCRRVVEECSAGAGHEGLSGGNSTGERGAGGEKPTARSSAARHLGRLWRERRPWSHRFVDALTGREQPGDDGWRRVLVEALLRDLRSAKRQSALRPWRRPPTGPFLLLVVLGPDEPDAERRALAGQLVAEIAACAPQVSAPLLVLSAGASAAALQPAVSVPAAARKVRLVRAARSLAVELEDPKNSTVLTVEPFRPAPVSRRLPGSKVVAGAVVAAIAFGAACWYVGQSDPERCPGLRKADKAGTTQVGIDLGRQGCSFTTAPEQQKIRDLQTDINKENKQVVDADEAGDGSSYVTVVFVAPLTDNPGGDDGQITPSAVMQLQGAFDAQKYYNHNKAALVQGGVRIRMLVANTGFAFEQGPAVARQIAELTRTDPHIVAVIGIAQSRQKTVEAIDLLPEKLPVVSAAATGDFLAYTKYQRYFQTQPDNRIMARAMVTHILKNRPKSVLVVYGDNDLYSVNLRSDLMGELEAQHNNKNVTSVVLREQGNNTPDDGPTVAKKMCDTYKAGGAVLYAARGTQLPRLWGDMRTSCGTLSNRQLPVLAADINTVMESTTIDPQTYPGAGAYKGVKLSYVAFSKEGNSDEATGRDAFFTLATAVGVQGVNRHRDEVLTQLRKGVQVPESSVQNHKLNQSSEKFTVADWNRDMAGRNLWICDAPAQPGGKKECQTP